ncbi:hypothetical protein B5M09_002696 [Aphanomyces astaci]|uniref:Myb-like domain-containing protein n=1 Tax=Aphanomyces astaci TaxID=112090 RepID=A0A3R7W166_APHAT|nr:hypothetical protein B5M09_002696 [Aphanomyces astaci]
MDNPEPARGWTSDEHLRFLDGLELHGTSQHLRGDDDGSTPWISIAAHVQTRNESETKEHGERYLHALLTQSLLATKGQGGSTTWTADEDAVFEAELAKWIHTPHAWTKIAMQLPGKTVYDVMDRYDTLLRDLSAIESGVTPPPIADMHDASTPVHYVESIMLILTDFACADMTLICSIANAHGNHVLFDVFKDAYDNPCSAEIATYVASAVVGMVAATSAGTTNGDSAQSATLVKRGRPKGKVAKPLATMGMKKKPPPFKAKKSPKRKKSNGGGLASHRQTTTHHQNQHAPPPSRGGNFASTSGGALGLTLPPLFDGKMLPGPGMLLLTPGRLNRTDDAPPLHRTA